MSVLKTYGDETKKIELVKLSNTLCSSAVEQLRLRSATRCRVEEGGINGCLGSEYEVIGGQVGMRFQTDVGCGLGWSQVICV